VPPLTDEEALGSPEDWPVAGDDPAVPVEEPMDADAELLEAADRLPPVVADVAAPVPDGVVVAEFAAVPELPQAEAKRPMMPTAATPVMDLRNMKDLSKRVGIHADDWDDQEFSRAVVAGGSGLQSNRHPFPARTS